MTAYFEASRKADATVAVKLELNNGVRLSSLPRNLGPKLLRLGLHILQLRFPCRGRSFSFSGPQNPAVRS